MSDYLSHAYSTENFGQFVENKISAAGDAMELEIEAVRNNRHICYITREIVMNQIWEAYLAQPLYEMPLKHLDA